MIERPLLETDLVQQDAIRPAGSPDRCFYCSEPLGDAHRPGCVMRQKVVKIRAIIDYEVKVPASWDEAMILFHRNEATWCSDNMETELEAVDHYGHLGSGSEGDCRCGFTRFEMVKSEGRP